MGVLGWLTVDVHVLHGDAVQVGNAHAGIRLVGVGHQGSTVGRVYPAHLLPLDWVDWGLLAVRLHQATRQHLINMEVNEKSRVFSVYIFY